jgi:hypothetical protein
MGKTDYWLCVELTMRRRSHIGLQWRDKKFVPIAHIAFDVKAAITISLDPAIYGSDT